MNQRFEETYCLFLQGSHSSTLMIKATSSCKTLISNYQIIRYHVPPLLSMLFNNDFSTYTISIDWMDDR
jgi:hypothetical protein